MKDSAIAFPKNHDLSGLRLTQGPNGYVYSPWFSFEWRTANIFSPSEYSSRYHAIIAASKEAFARILNIERIDIVVTMRNDLSEMSQEWRLSTRRPVALPKPPAVKRAALPDAIDI